MKIGNKFFNWGERTFIMGILNMTPDSFSDGGKFYDLEKASLHASKMCLDGADIIDIGGESTRPGSFPVDSTEEISRILPIIKRIKENIDIPISVDTYKAKTAEAVLEAGADMINDVWGLKYDVDLAKVVSNFNVPICIMHNRPLAVYENLIEEIIVELKCSIEIALTNGISESNIILDPGIGFGKTYEQNILVMKNLAKLKSIGFPLLLGTSRKSFIGRTLNLDTSDRLEGTLATSVYGITCGVDMLRVHDVLENKRATIITDRMVR